MNNKLDDLIALYDAQKASQSDISIQEVLNKYNELKKFYGLSHDDNMQSEAGKNLERYILTLFYALYGTKKLIQIDDEWYFTITRDKTKHQVKLLNVSLCNVNQIMKLDISKPGSFNFLFEGNINDAHFNSNTANLFKIINFFLIGEASV